MKTAIVTDSTCYLTKEEISNNHIVVVPIPVVIDGKSYDEGVDITTEEFYQKLRTSGSFPSTTQPSLGKMIELYKHLRDEGYENVISIHLASTISGFVSSLDSIKDEIDGLNVYVYDSEITVRLMGSLVLEAAQMAREERTPEDILTQLNKLRATFGEYFIVDDLQNLVRGGRLSNASAFIGGLLKIKPILTFNDAHEIVAFEKVRSTKKAFTRVEELFAQNKEKIDYPIRAIIIHANDEPAALKWRERLQAKYPDLPIDISYFGPVIGTHLGEKALALAWLRDYTKD
ncbi:DegV family protein [Pediococcus damnosus]|uniref:DegV family protein n=1 Tax=Pediococcus damnosus TaxID=51663 RepID=A0A0R2GSG0_9LACO|nr:DegV family protein [Pediococcus damnosus]AMV61514.1 DegV family protein [Pediococcus damnosus]AMV62120.1 DegV family protein [Pediococcus damnosus]AMV65876.1 DegV family protein [Pediococcus damnosus]AMV68026.1 DegV family protein [Pediococcus damnosus]AMV70216.1 DegV family protein [Pediococcus damnosus]